MPTRELLPKFLTTVEVDPPVMGESLTRPVEKPAIRRRGRPVDGKTETIHQYARRVRDIVKEVLDLAFAQSKDTPADERIDIAEKIVRSLERPFPITTGLYAGHFVSGLAQGQKDIRRAIEAALDFVSKARTVDIESGRINRRRLNYQRTLKGRSGLATDLTFTILNFAGKPMRRESLHRILSKD